MLDAEAFITLALDLTTSLGATDRYQRLLDVVRRVVPCDAAAVMRLEEKELPDSHARPDSLVAVGTHGLRGDVLGRRFVIAEHPRLKRICMADGVVCFPEDSPLEDPFDGLLADDPTALGRVHACLGVALRVEGELVGVLTADALDPTAFRALELDSVRALAALAGAALRTTELISALERRSVRDVGRARGLVHRGAAGRTLVGRSRSMATLKSEIEMVGPSDLSVLVQGETGVGKELVVQAIHGLSPRSSVPLVYLNCAALPESLVESELFGHARGAFTSAHAEREGKLQLANGGTLFLDEVGELPLSIQPKLLRALQQGEVQKVGSNEISYVDVRIIAATNRNLGEEVLRGHFRADLYHRLAVYPLRVPSLRERRSDVPLLAGHFAEQARSRFGLRAVRLRPAVLDRMTNYEWPGNVRELENALTRAIIRAASRAGDGDVVIVSEEDLDGHLDGDGQLETPVLGVRTSASTPGTIEAAVCLPEGMSLREGVEAFQRGVIQRVAHESGGNWSEAARRLGMDRGNLHHLAVRLGLKSRGGPQV